MTVLRIYTDGGCAGNQSKTNFGGWGAVLEYGQHQKELHGGARNTTNNLMEMTALLEAFSLSKKGPDHRGVFRQLISYGLLQKEMVCKLAEKRLENSEKRTCRT